MTTIGFKNVPFQVGIAMHSAIHSTHHVSLYAHDARLTFPSGGTSKVFTPANWSVPQNVTVNFNGTGDAELLADITNDYFVNGAGEHRVKHDLIDLSVTALPLDVWTGSTPVWSFTAGGGDLAVAHNNLVNGHRAFIGITGGTTSGLTYDNSSAFTATTTTIEVTKPNGAIVVITGGGVLVHTMDQLGVYRFRPLMPFAVLQNAQNVGHFIQQSDFEFGVDNGSGGVVVATTTKSAVKSQGIAATGSALQPSLISTPNGPIPTQTIPVTYAEKNVVGGVSFRVVGGPTEFNCHSSAAGVTGDTITIDSIRINAFASFSAFWAGSGFMPTVGGADTGSPGAQTCWQGGVTGS